MMKLRLALISFVLCLVGAASQAGEAGFHKGEWPFTPLTRPPIPVTRRNDWGHNPVDAFVLAEMERKGLQPSITADRTMLLRRVTFDLTGLPPTVEELQTFLSDNSPEAYEHAVDRLLASPRFGERWARHWLDVVHFADTAGFRNDFLRTDAYRYRDYVIEAFNEDLPFDRFVQQQIAGDELEPGNPDALVATGMLRLYAEESTAADFLKMRQDILDDITETAGLTFLGLTMGCARCHDHKFDPIAQADFYRLQACFVGIVPNDERPAVEPEVLATYERQYKLWADATASIRHQIDAMEDALLADAADKITVAYDADTRQAWLTNPLQRTTRQMQLVALSNRYVRQGLYRRIRKLEGEQKAKYEDLNKRLAEFDPLKPLPLPTSMAVQEGSGPAPPTHVLATGDYRKPEEEVRPGFPEFLGEDQNAAPSLSGQTPGRRSALARWLTLPDHPLTARVMVNRLWQHHFGRGIVETPNDFGAMGEAASHPKLLDWLASELVERNWSMKSIHRLMVTSATYQQTSLIDSAAQVPYQQIDPDNKFLWHANRVRLDAEPLRDSMLFLSGSLNENMGGPSGYAVLSEAVRQNSTYAWSPDDNPAQHVRRSIYLFQKRNLRIPLLASFDQPDMYLSCGARSTTLTATQSLALLNGDDASAAARSWAGRLLSEPGDEASRIRQAWLEAYSRTPSAQELEGAKAFLHDQAQRSYDEHRFTADTLPQPCPTCMEPHTAAAYVDLCHALLNSSEFVFID